MTFPGGAVLGQIGLAIGSVLVLLAAMGLLKRISDAYGWSAEAQRKIVHMGVGLFAMALPWLFLYHWPVYVVLAFTLIVLFLLRFLPAAQKSLGATLHAVNRETYGDFLFVLAVGMVYAIAVISPVSRYGMVLYLLPIAVLTLADSAAALVGIAYGRIQYQIEEGTKSVEGSVIFFLITYVLTSVALLLLTDLGRVNVVMLSFMIALFASMVEADSWRGFDNLFIPLGVLLILLKGMKQTPEELAWMTGAFLAAVGTIWMLAPRLGLQAHSARVYVLSVVLIFSVTPVHNAVFPVLTMAAYVLANHVKPGDDRYPHLNVVAAIAVISVFWLTIGLALDHDATAFFTTTFLGFTVLLVTLSLTAVTVWIRIAALAGLLAGLDVLYAYILRLDLGGEEAWYGDLYPVAGAAALLSLIIPLAAEPRFKRNRSAKAAVIALIIPAAAYGVIVARTRGLI